MRKGEKLEPDLNCFYKHERTCRSSEDFCSDKSVFLMIIGIGASSYVMRCRVTVDTQDLATQRERASAIQGSSTSGLKDLWMIAFPHNVKIELTCVVESFKDKTTIHWLYMKTEYI